jgi:hypothetical protein
VHVYAGNAAKLEALVQASSIPPRLPVGSFSIKPLPAHARGSQAPRIWIAVFSEHGV